jgi:uncharacterized protein (DUF697 family)
MTHQERVAAELAAWQAEMKRSPSLINGLSKRLQDRVNGVIPEKVHQTITAAIKQMTRAVIFGAEFTSPKDSKDLKIEVREFLVLDKIKFYSKTAAAEGAVTGAGGFLLGLADFPIWLTLKIKMLYEIAGIYGADVRNYKERVYLLYIFQLTFSSQKNRNAVYRVLENWDDVEKQLPNDINEFDWRTFQQEYRDYIDIAKLLQLIPGVGAVVGAYVNHRLTRKLGVTAMNSYRMRWLKNSSPSQYSLTR